MQSIFLTPRILEPLSQLASQMITGVAGRPFKSDKGMLLMAFDLALRMGLPLAAATTYMYATDDGGIAFKGRFLLGAIRASGRFDSELRFEVGGEGESKTCRAYTTSMGREFTSDIIRADEISDETLNENLAWLKHPDLCLKYRAASNFANAHIPDLLTGFEFFPNVAKLAQKLAEPETTADLRPSQVALAPAPDGRLPAPAASAIAPAAVAAAVPTVATPVAIPDGKLEAGNPKSRKRQAPVPPTSAPAPVEAPLSAEAGGRPPAAPTTPPPPAVEAPTAASNGEVKIADVSSGKANNRNSAVAKLTAMNLVPAVPVGPVREF